MAAPAVLLAVICILLLAWCLLRFCFADADLSLLAKGPPPPGCFEDKVVWITGASQGIGETLARELSRLGAKLILSARDAEKLNGVKERCQGKHGPEGVEIVPFDLAGGPGALAEATRRAEACFGGTAIDILIHNAAYPRPKITCQESPDDLLRKMFEVNVFAPIELTRCALPKMVARGSGHIVVVSSAAGKVPSPTQGVYSATKHAVNGYFHTLRSELTKQGVGVTVICPGPIATSTPRRLPRGGAGGGASEPPDVHTAAPDSADEEKNRMTADRCAQLILAATGHRVEEAWISRQPVLLFMYIMQYLPGVGYLLLRKIGPKRVQALKEGHKDLYTMNLLFGGAGAEKKKM